jgi:hypothetical protein
VTYNARGCRVNVRTGAIVSEDGLIGFLPREVRIKAGHARRVERMPLLFVVQYLRGGECRARLGGVAGAAFELHAVGR